MKETLYKWWKRFLTWFGDLYFATSPPSIRWKDIEPSLSLIEDGMIICRGYDAYLDSYFIPGDFSHSGVIVGGRVYHAVAEGVRSDHFVDFVIDTDRYLLLAPQYDSKQQKNKVLDTARSLIGAPYDFLFDDGVEEMYCHEFTAHCLMTGGVNVDKVNKAFGIWPVQFMKRIYLAESFIDRFKVLFKFQ